MKNILVVSPLFPNSHEPLKGMFVKEQVVRLRKYFNIQVISPVPWSLPWGCKKWRMKAAIPSHDIIDGIEAWYPRYFMTPKAGRSLYGLLYFLSLARFVKRLVNGRVCDAILVHWAYPDAFGMTLINFLLKKPLFIQVHGSDINVHTKFYLRRRMIIFSLKRVKKIFSVGYQLQERMAALGVGRDHIDVVSNGFDAVKFLVRDRNCARVHLGLSLRKKIVLFVGNLVEVKGLPYLIDAASLLLKERREILFLMIGEGDCRKVLNSMILKNNLQENVRLLGGRPHREIPYWMNSCDLFCLPSLSEGCPTVLIEALASGRPIVGTDVGDIPYLVKRSQGGYVVRPKDSQALAQAIAKGLDQVWDPEKLSRSVHDLTWENVAEKVYSEMIK